MLSREIAAPGVAAKIVMAWQNDYTARRG